MWIILYRLVLFMYWFLILMSIHKSFREIYDDFWKKKSDLYNIITKTSL